MTETASGIVLVDVPTTDLAALLRLAHPDYATSEEAATWRALNIDRYMESWESVKRALTDRRQQAITAFGSLYLMKRLADGTLIDLGLAGHHKVTTAGCQKIVAMLNQGDTTTALNFRYHGIGTTNTAEANADTALAAELDNELAIANTRPTGSQGQGASAVVYRTSAICQLGTIVGGPLSVVEHGVFSAATTGSGTLLDRTVFAGISLNSNEAVNAQYDLTLAAGG